MPLTLPGRRDAAWIRPSATGLLVATSVLAISDLQRFKRSLKPGLLARWQSLKTAQPLGAGSEHPSAPTYIFDAAGNKVASLNAGWVALQDLSPAVWQAVVSSEDRRFFRHRGVDLVGVLRAVSSLGRNGGGSTITQQLVKNLVLSDSRTVSRKLAEVVLAVWLDCTCSKSHILEMYLNNVYFGHGLTGVRQAAAAYFGKPPGSLSLSEAALLAAILPAPERLSPFHDPQTSQRVHGQVIAGMVASRCLNPEQAECIKREGLPPTLASTVPGFAGVSAASGGPFRAPFFVSEVLEQMPHLLDSKLPPGLRIHTTLDLALQEKAEALLHRMDAGKDEQAVLIAMCPDTGAIPVLVGGRDFGHSSFNRATLSRRSPGSALKPVVVLAALASRLVTCSTKLLDEATTFRRDSHGWAAVTKSEEANPDPNRAALQQQCTFPQPSYSPGDYHEQAGVAVRADVPAGAGNQLTDEVEYNPHNFNREFHGRVSVAEALSQSLNIPTVIMANLVGLDAVHKMARALGLTSPLPHTLAMALGACEVTPMEVTTVYNTLAAAGTRMEPFCISRVEDAAGNVLFQHKPDRKRVVDKDACLQLTRMLRSSISHGTGRAAGMGWASGHAAGKTGTSECCRDAWMAGFTPFMTCVVWVGRDDNKPLQGTGGTLAAPLWARFMQESHRQQPNPQQRRRKRHLRRESL